MSNQEAPSLMNAQRIVRDILAGNNSSNNGQHAAQSRPGMNDLAKIVLDMYRDIKRVTNAIV